MNEASKLLFAFENTCIHTSTQSTIKQALYLMIIWINYILRKIGIINHILSFLLEFFLKRLSQAILYEWNYEFMKTEYNFENKSL